MSDSDWDIWKERAELAVKEGFSPGIASLCRGCWRPIRRIEEAFIRRSWVRAFCECAETPLTSMEEDFKPFGAEMLLFSSTLKMPD